MPRDQFTLGRAAAPYIGPAAAPPPKALVAALARYHPSLRARLRRFAVVSRASADLVAAFPAAAVLIATMERGPEATGRAVALVKTGAPLRAVAHALALPLWTRKLSPETFTAAPLGAIGGGPDFARRVANHMPKSADNAAMWLDWALAALRLGDEPFAAWMAAQPIYEGAALPASALELLAVFAWSARTAQLDWCQKAWAPQRGFAGVVKATNGALRKFLQESCSVQTGGDAWNGTSSVAGFRFTPLTTREELKQEGAAMKNCLATYGARVAAGESLIFAMRRGKRSVASIELLPTGARGQFRLGQFEGPDNGPASPRESKALQKWLATLGPCPLRRRGLLRRGELDGATWKATWAPFVAEHPSASALWSSDQPAEILEGLEARVAVLEQALGRERAARAER